MNSLSDFLSNAVAVKQIQTCAHWVEQNLARKLVGMYLYGSSLLGGLQKYSDLDLLVIVKESLTKIEKQQLSNLLLSCSKFDEHADEFPIELTVLRESDIHPWHYPPICHYQFGEWLRDNFEQNDSTLDNNPMPDLAVVLSQVKLNSFTLIGQTASTVVPDIPLSDIQNTMSHAVPELLRELESDTRNVLLTLARIWCTLETGTLYPKVEAAIWACERIEDEHKPILLHAKAVCLGEIVENWQDIHAIKACVKSMQAAINQVPSWETRQDIPSLKILSQQVRSCKNR